MESKHTKGPWRHSEAVAGDVLDPWGRVVCSVAGDMLAAAETDANQALIAAAPELLAASTALRQAQRAYMADRGNDALGKAVAAAAENLDAAIAKAEGR